MAPPPKNKRGGKSGAYQRRGRNKRCQPVKPKVEQDMESCTCAVPNEILSKILSRCDDRTLLTARQTCRRWRYIIDETIGVSITIGSPCVSSINPPNTNFQPIEVIESIGVKSCYVGELVDVQGCPFQYPQTVRRIVFDGPVTNFNLITLLAPLPTLTHLTLHYFALEDAKLRPDTVQSGSLKSLRITSHLVHQSYERSKAVQVLENVVTLLLSIHSQLLETLVLDVLHIPEYERNLTKAILTVLVRHKVTLQTTQVYHTMRLQEPDPPGTGDDHDELPLEKEEIVYRAFKEVVHIKRICYAGLRDMPSDPIWMQLISSQKSLQELFYMNDNRGPSSTGVSCLKMNSTTLRKLLFHINAVDDARNTTIFDCGVFRNFKNLSHLLIRGRQVLFRNIIDAEANVARITMKIPVLRHVQAIPSSVTVLSLRDIHVDTQSLSRFAVWLPPNLVKFRLVDAGCFGEYGITPEGFLELLECRGVKEIEIIRSFNKNCWDLATGKDIYEEALFYRIKSLWQFHSNRERDESVVVFKSGPMFDYGQSETTLRANDVCEVVFQ